MMWFFKPKDTSNNKLQGRLLTSDKEAFGIDLQYKSKFVRFEFDGKTLVPQSIRGWNDIRGHYSDGNPIWSTGLQIEVNEIPWILSELFAFLKSMQLKPSAILFKERDDCIQWQEWLKPYLDSLEQITLTTEVDLKRNKLCATLDHEPFGCMLIEKVVEMLMKCDCRDGHKEYCGHGLFYRNGKYLVATVYDGSPYTNLAEWNDSKSFIEFFSKMSDFSCSGADENCKIFRVADNPWLLNNQTITKRKLQEFTSTFSQHSSADFA